MNGVNVFENLFRNDGSEDMQGKMEDLSIFFLALANYNKILEVSNGRTMEEIEKDLATNINVNITGLSNYFKSLNSEDADPVSKFMLVVNSIIVARELHREKFDILKSKFEEFGLALKDTMQSTSSEVEMLANVTNAKFASITKFLATYNNISETAASVATVNDNIVTDDSVPSVTEEVVDSINDGDDEDFLNPLV